MSQEKQTAPGVPTDQLKRNAQRRNQQRLQERRIRLMVSLAGMLECPVSDIPRYARIHGISL